MNAREEQRVAVTAFIAAVAEGLRFLGPNGANEDELYDAVGTMADRRAFNLIVDELIKQKTVKRVGNRLVYCGPCAFQ